LIRNPALPTPVASPLCTLVGALQCLDPRLRSSHRFSTLTVKVTHALLDIRSFATQMAQRTRFPDIETGRRRVDNPKAATT